MEIRRKGPYVGIFINKKEGKMLIRVLLASVEPRVDKYLSTGVKTCA